MRLVWQISLSCITALLLIETALSQPGYSKPNVRDGLIPQSLVPTINKPSKFCKNHALDEFSRELLEAAIAVSQRISDPDQNVDALTAIAETYYCTFGQTEQANQLLLQTLITIREINSPARRARMLADVVGSYQAIAAPKSIVEPLLAEALVLVTAIKETSSEKDDALHQIAFRYALEQQQAQAMKAVEQLSNGFDREITAKAVISLIIRTQAEAGQHEAALRSIQTATFKTVAGHPIQAAAIAQNTVSERLQLLTELANTYKNLGQTEQIAVVLNQTLQILTTIKDSKFKLCSSSAARAWAD